MSLLKYFFLLDSLWEHKFYDSLMYFYDLCRTLKFDGFLGELYELWIRKVVKFTEIFSVLCEYFWVFNCKTTGAWV